MLKSLPVMQKTQEMPRIQPLGWEDPLEEDKATHSSILDLENPMDRGARQATGHGFTQSQTRWKRLSARASLFTVGYIFACLCAYCLSCPVSVSNVDDAQP